MPITINEILKRTQLFQDLHKVKWGQAISSKESGVYIISMSNDPSVNTTMERLPISMNILQSWIDKLSGFKLDKEFTFDLKAIINRISIYWLSDENILYIGKATNLNTRVRQFYTTKIGEKKPHAGGHWLKMLSNLSDLYVYYIECEDSESKERELLDAFNASASFSKTLRLRDGTMIIPFANLQNSEKKRKNHGLTHMTSPK
ncbi:GIY-YIG nuclease family protein [Bacteroides neonati]|uniref:hypothetical protein n=1 Tax=Bacteroides neonati TaxID=1347393 RepID=UPI0004B9C7EE|nr:hypothetical protein [Bacteroides neonati]